MCVILSSTILYYAATRADVESASFKSLPSSSSALALLSDTLTYNNEFLAAYFTI